MPFLQLPVEKLKNKVICDKHFPETAFMNYTRSKLTKTTSVPTIYFNEEDQEVDLLEGPTDWVIENRNNRPAPGFLATPSKPYKMKLEMEDSQEQFMILNQSPAKKAIQLPQKRTQSDIKTEVNSQPAVRILNRLPQTTVSLNNQLHSLGELKQIVKKSASTINIQKKVAPPPEKIRIVSPPEKRFLPSSSTPKIIKQEIIHHPQDDSQIEFMYLNEGELSTVKSAPDCSQDIKSLAKEVSEIKSMLSEKLAQPQQPNTSTASLNESSNITQSQFNKVQLFNGIKRYLSPSLIALLRMEIFAAPNREYKKDEKIICSEILKLGGEIYDFFSDEWRLRLPSKEIVKNWQSEELTDDDAS